MSILLRSLSALLAPALLAAQTPALDGLLIHVLQGEGAVYAPGSRAATGLLVEVTDGVRKPVEGAAVSFQLPAKGPGGLFPNGLTSDVVLTGPDGRAAVSGIRWNQTPGEVMIRVTAAKGDARAGLIVRLTLGAAVQQAVPAADPELPPFKPSRRWLKITALLAGVGAGSTLAGLAIVKRQASAPAAPTSAAPVVGTPIITIGGPK